MHIYDVTIIGESGMSSDVPLPPPEAGMRAVNKDWDRHVLVARVDPVVRQQLIDDVLAVYGRHIR